MKKQINARARGDREKSCNIKYFIHNYTHKEQRSNKENQRKKLQKMLFFPSYLKPSKNTETTRELQEQQTPLGTAEKKHDDEQK